MPAPAVSDESEWRNGEVKPVRMVEVRADELRINDTLDEGVRVVGLHWDKEHDDRVWVTTTNPVSTRIVWPRDHQVRVIRGEHWRPGLGLRGEHS